MKWFTLSILLIITSCDKNQDFYTLPTFENGKLNAVIEIPSGTNLKIEYDHKTKKFIPDQRNGKDRSIDFLGYPGNYGFIPSTYSDPKKGGDGDALDVVVLSTPLPTSTVIPVISIGILKLVDDGELDYKIIAVPVDPAKRNITAENWQKFTTEYKSAQEILGIWFTNYDAENETKIEGWGNAEEALNEIKKWSKTTE